MNWTEGNLARHSRGRQSQGREQLQRQRQHFAKSRARLPGKQSPPASHENFSNPSFVPASTLLGRKRRRNAEGLENDLPVRSNLFQGKRSGRHVVDSHRSADIAYIAEKRRKLLSRSDWVSTEAQKEIPIKFSHSSSLSSRRPWRRPKKPAHEVHAPALSKIREKLEKRNSSSDQELQVRIGSQKSLENPSSARLLSRSGSHSEIASRSSDRVGSSDRLPTFLLGSDASDISRHHGNSTDNGQPIVTTSPLVVHPAPRRVSSLHLRHSTSSGSDSMNSIKAQVGQHVPFISPSKQLENDEWRYWLQGSDTSFDTRMSIVGSREEHPERHNISPGVSEMHHRPENAMHLEEACSVRRRLWSPPRQERADTENPALPRRLSVIREVLDHEEQDSPPNTSVRSARGSPAPDELTSEDEQTTEELHSDLDSMWAKLFGLKCDDEGDSTTILGEEQDEPVSLIATRQVSPFPSDTIEREQEHGQDDNGVHTDTRSRLGVEADDRLKTVQTPFDRKTDMPKQTSRSIPEDSADEWKKFVFGSEGTTDLEDAALNEAKQEAYNTIDNMIHRPMGSDEWGRDISTAGLPSRGCTASTAETDTSHDAMVGSSSSMMPASDAVDLIPTTVSGSDTATENTVTSAEAEAAYSVQVHCSDDTFSEESSELGSRQAMSDARSLIVEPPQTDAVPLPPNKRLSVMSDMQSLIVEPSQSDAESTEYRRRARTYDARSMTVEPPLSDAVPSHAGKRPQVMSDIQSLIVESPLSDAERIGSGRRAAHTSDARSMIVEPPQSDGRRSKFILPKLSARKLPNLKKSAIENAHANSTSTFEVKGKPKRGNLRNDQSTRKQTTRKPGPVKTSYGKTNIRSLPNYSGDPIEDIADDEVDSPPRLFSALETSRANDAWSSDCSQPLS